MIPVRHDPFQSAVLMLGFLAVICAAIAMFGGCRQLTRNGTYSEFPFKWGVER